MFTFAGRVKSSEKVNEQRDDAQARGTALRYVEGETCGEQRPGHLGESKLLSVVSMRRADGIFACGSRMTYEKERPATEGINREESRPGEHKVDQTEAERGDQRVLLACTSLHEDSG